MRKRKERRSGEIALIFFVSEPSPYRRTVGETYGKAHKNYDFHPLICNIGKKNALFELVYICFYGRKATRYIHS